MTRKIPLTEEQIQQLRTDKQSGMTLSDMMFKYNLGKSSVYSYLKESPSRPPTPEQKAITVQIDPEPDYLDNIIIKDNGEPDPEEDKDDDVVQEISKNLGKGKLKKGPITQDQIPDIVNDFLNKRKKAIDEQPKTDNQITKEEKPEKEVIPKKTVSKKQTESDNHDERLEKITKIMNYINAFEDKLKEILPIENTEKVDHKKRYIVSLHKMKVVDLDVQLDLIRGYVGKTTSHKAYKIGYLGVIDIVEKLGNRFTNDNLNGLRQDCEVNEQLDQVIKELACEYDLMSKFMKPEYRLVGLTGLQVMSTWKKNSIIKRQQQIIESLSKDKPIASDLENKYSDL